MLARLFRRRLEGRRPWLVCAGLVLGLQADVEPDGAVGCELSSASVRVYEGSRLFDTREGRLTLMRGRTLPCEHPAARGVLTAIEAALGSGVGRAIRERLAAPLHVHIDPRLPARQAALGGVEVHVSSREILVAGAALQELPERAWRHELLHALAPPPPPLSRAGRQLWSTLEEGLVAFLTDGGAGAAEMWRARPEATQARAADRRPALLPLIEWLESPAYDPHPLAAGLARELAEAGAPASSFLDCLTLEPPAVQHAVSSAAAASGRQTTASRRSARPQVTAAARAAPSLPDELLEVFGAFAARCPAGAQVRWATAVERWWGAPPATPASRGPVGKAAARVLESR
jgi:hypothetical protein